MSREEMLKHTTGRTRVFLDTLTNQAGLDAWELALEQFPRMRELPPQEQAWTVESVMQIMEENKLPTTIDDALHAAKFLECSQIVDRAAAGEQPGPAAFTPKSADGEADFYNNPNTSAEQIGQYLRLKHNHR